MGRKFSSTSRATGLAVAVTSSATTMQVQSVAGLPAVPFTLIVDWGTESEEIVEVTSVAGLSLTVIRGVDGTAGLPHQVGAVIRHGATARDFRDFVNHSEASTLVHGLTGGAAVVGTSQTQTLTNKSVDGGQNTVTNLPTTAYANLSVTTAKLADGAATTAKIPDANVTTAKIADNAVTKVKMADNSVGTAEIEDGAVATAKIPDGAVTTPKIPDLGVTTPKLAADAVTPAKLTTPWEVVASVAARATLVTTLNAAGRGPTVDRPLAVWRKDAVAGWNLEVSTDGTNWRSFYASTAPGSPLSPLTGVGGWTAGAEAPRFRRVGDEIVGSGLVVRTGDTTIGFNGILVGTVPAGMAPAENTGFVVAGNALGHLLGIEVRTNGEVWARNWAGVNAPLNNGQFLSLAQVRYRAAS